LILTEWKRYQLRDEAFAWHHDESEYQTYSAWQASAVIVEDHLQELVRAQEAIVGLLVNDLPKFDAHNGMTIVEARQRVSQC
jgi:hypothetical protein